jgi:hypothetical protein
MVNAGVVVDSDLREYGWIGMNGAVATVKDWIRGLATAKGVQLDGGGRRKGKAALRLTRRVVAVLTPAVRHFCIRVSSYAARRPGLEARECLNGRDE